ncbi:L-gulonolactone oxidase-like [Bradysia coprophila]|uniref:L-gulonolactone oxidase-like n=1 Tax=Bradysia coprophila TaxID=38358 RepID=UPI00187D7B7E|nr:L-gulonolactone oxidase-like [Bradysia coprophila]
MAVPKNFHSFILQYLTVVLPIISPVFVRCEIPTKNYSSYSPYPLCVPSDYMVYPTNISQVVAIVNEAITRGITIKAFGNRHSQTDIICTDGIPVDMSEYKFFRMNDDNVTATFGPGVTIYEAGEFLLQYRRALRTTAAFGNITLGGAIGTGAHGSTLKYNSTISEQVVRLTVVNGLGEIVEIFDPQDLNAFKVNLGLLGILVEITLYTVPLYKVLAHNYVVSDEILTDGTALNWARNSDQITFYWFPAFQQVVVANLTFVSASSPGEAYTNAVAPRTYGYFNYIATKSKEFAYDLTSSQCTLASTLGNKIARSFEIIAKSGLVTQTLGTVPIYTEDGNTVENPATGFPHAMFSVPCGADDVGFSGESCHWAHGDIKSNISILDNEVCIDVDDLSAFVIATKDIVAKTPTVFPLQGLFMRLSSKSNAYMSTAYQRDSIHVEFAVWKRTNVYDEASGSLAGYQSIMQLLTKRFQARSHWGKSGLFYHSSEMLDLKLNDTARANFVGAMTKFDPNGIFLNKFGLRITGDGTAIDSDPLMSTNKCALLDTCICSKDSDCGNNQLCSTLPGYTYPVCKTKNEEPDLLDLTFYPPISGLLDWLNETVPVLASTVNGQCSLLGGIGGILG